MRGNNVHEAKTDPRRANQWRYTCQVCGTPFKRAVDTCADCGSSEIDPIEGSVTDA